jgi:hypothetical protein
MKINEKELRRILCEEISKIEEIQPFGDIDIQEVVDRLFRKLDSIDMSLDLIYGALADTDEPISVTRSRQRAFGRLTRPKSRASEVN